MQILVFPFEIPDLNKGERNHPWGTPERERMRGNDLSCGFKYFEISLSIFLSM